MGAERPSNFLLGPFLSICFLAQDITAYFVARCLRPGVSYFFSKSGFLLVGNGSQKAYFPIPFGHLYICMGVGCLLRTSAIFFLLLSSWSSSCILEINSSYDYDLETWPFLMKKFQKEHTRKCGVECSAQLSMYMRQGEETERVQRVKVMEVRIREMGWRQGRPHVFPQSSFLDLCAGNTQPFSSDQAEVISL